MSINKTTPCFAGRMVKIGENAAIDSDNIQSVHKDKYKEKATVVTYTLKGKGASIDPSTQMSFFTNSNYKPQEGLYTTLFDIDKFKEICDKISTAKTTSGKMIDLTA